MGRPPSYRGDVSGPWVAAHPSQSAAGGDDVALWQGQGQADVHQAYAGDESAAGGGVDAAGGSGDGVAVGESLAVEELSLPQEALDLARAIGPIPYSPSQPSTSQQASSSYTSSGSGSNDVSFEDGGPAPVLGAGGYDSEMAGLTARATGRWGEEFVHRLLMLDLLPQQEGDDSGAQQQTNKEGATSGSVAGGGDEAAGQWRALWVNKERESGAPYDVVLYSQESSADASGQQLARAGERVFVEVKSSRFSDKAAFDLSVAELEFAKEWRGAYWIYRVTGAGSADPRVTVIKDPYGMWVSKQVRVQMVAD